jgi:transcription termination/antitermination protein NusG
MTEQKWYVVQVFTAKENKVKTALEDLREQSGVTEQISEVLVPTENVSEVKDGESRIVERKIWPGYLLIKMAMTDEAWQYVKESNGVIGFLGDPPTPLTDGEVHAMLADLKEKKDTIKHRHQFQVGDPVKIVEGVFVNFQGTIIEVNHDKGRLSVAVNIFGRETRVDDLEFSQVEESTEATD